MRWICVVFITVVFFGCTVRETEYVETAQVPVSLIPRPQLQTGDPLTQAQLEADRSALKRCVRAWEQTVLDYNQRINEHNQKNGYPITPLPEAYPVVDYSTIETVEPVAVP